MTWHHHIEQSSGWHLGRLWGRYPCLQPGLLAWSVSTSWLQRSSQKLTEQPNCFWRFWARNSFLWDKHTFQRSPVSEVPTKSCPAKQTKRMKASERNAAPKEMPRMDVLPGNKRPHVRVTATPMFWRAPARLWLHTLGLTQMGTANVPDHCEEWKWTST